MKTKSLLLSALLGASLLCLARPADVSAAAAHPATAESAQAEDVSAALDGGWSVNEGRLQLGKHERLVFAKAIDHLLGCDYDPVALLGTQVVAGTNYCFLARLTPVVPDATPHWGLVYVYEDLQGAVTLSDVKDLPLGE